jgi:ABC-type Fe3+-hydroxamate transport system substrate-binding protein
VIISTDQLGNSIELKQKPTRIVSLVPSQTELLYDLGLEDQVVGITKFCVHPGKWFRSKKRVGGTKTINNEAVRELQPDLVIANKEENVKGQVEELRKFVPVWTSDINTLADALEMIEKIGELVDSKSIATDICTKIITSFETLSPLPQVNTAYLIWKDPYMAAGSDTFIHDLLTRLGMSNVVKTARYPPITVEEIQSIGCELLLLSSEPYPFKEKHIQELKNQLPHVIVKLVDGEMFSWYGSRLKLSAEYFRKMCADL